MKVVIATIAEDVHARAVRRGLERLGHEVVLLYTSAYPAHLRQTITLGPDGDSSWHMRLEPGEETAEEAQRDDDEARALKEYAHEAGAAELGDADVVWARRIRMPQPPAVVDQRDRAFVARELRFFHNALWHAAAPGAFWVNPFAAARRADSKILQLQVARAAGLTIPETIVTNDPAQIRAFLRRNRDAGVVYKPFAVNSWEEDGGMLATLASPVSEEDLPDDELLRATPNILQRRVPKAYEVRLTIMGAQAFAIRIDSQRHPDGSVDWRNIFPEELPLARVTLPPAVVEACRRVMRMLGIVFGCFDLIVTPEGDTVFLEVNEMGQWLWIEFRLPEVPLLDAFCRFLLSRDPEFVYRPEGSLIPLADIAAGRKAVVEV
ncbi:MAG: hypothetical protein KatS3mg119_1972 [Rhodothalassiaceae bacterium]|nr:MAG: hypothetical protein KatS3mg119_1972 [Rhodothalassiaceae bacterium]